MKIGVLGAGIIGRTIGKKWAAAGHELVFGVRDTGKADLQSFLDEIEGEGSIGSTAAAIDHGEVILVAIPGRAVKEMGAAFAAGLDGKLLIDATNNIGGPVLNSVAELAAHAPAARIFRAFNTLGWENFEEPRLAGEQIDLFFCGPDGDDRLLVEQLIADVGLRPVYVGDHGQLTAVDNITRLWFALAMDQGRGRRLAFKVLTG